MLPCRFLDTSELLAVAGKLRKEADMRFAEVSISDPTVFVFCSLMLCTHFEVKSFVAYINKTMSPSLPRN